MHVIVRYIYEILNIIIYRILNIHYTIQVIKFLSSFYFRIYLNYDIYLVSTYSVLLSYTHDSHNDIRITCIMSSYIIHIIN